jgi:hypothetical protein
MLTKGHIISLRLAGVGRVGELLKYCWLPQLGLKYCWLPQLGERIMRERFYRTTN